MQVGVLGPLELVVDGQTVDVGGAKVRALLTRLAVDAGRPVPVDALTAALWPDRPPADERHALQALVSRLRGHLGGRVRAMHGGYLLDVAEDAVDVATFERAVHDGRSALRADRPGEAAQRLRAALGLWRGSPLVDAGRAEYAVALTARLDELRVDATETRVEAELRLGQVRHLVAELEQLTAEHPERERLRALHVRALHADGRQAEALTAYERYREQLADELGTDPGEELRAAHLAALRDPVPPDLAQHRRGNLRAPLTSFVGRDHDLEQVATTLQAGRLVTLVGPGGVGKTRLATAAGARYEQAWDRPVWLVELAAATETSDLAQTVLDTLGLRGAPANAPTSWSPAGDQETAAGRARKVVDALAGSDALLLLDNCEHLLPQVAELVEELLGRCPSLRLLVTSREPLRASGETLHEVLPLQVDEPAAAAEGAPSPAVCLFRDRAAAVRPDFQLTAENTDTVTDVCHRLDGLPLAVELAAARLRSMPLAELATRLDDRFGLLTTGRRTAPARHRTLRAVVAWSWDLLDEDLRCAAERLAVFPTTFTSAAAEHLDVPRETLDSLVDKSLLQLAEPTTPRYRMSSTVREYAMARLTESGHRTEAQRAHLAYFLDLAERAEPWLRGAQQLTWLGELRAERDNLTTAVRSALDSGQVPAAVRLAAALGLFWTIHGDHAAAATRLHAVLEETETSATEPPADALLAVTATYLVNAMLAGLGEQARAFVRPPAEPPSHGPMAALVASALAADTPDAAELLHPHLAHPDPWKRGLLHLFAAVLVGSHGDWQQMSTHLTEAHVAFREVGERWGQATSLTYLALMHSTLGDHQTAVAELDEAATLAAELGYDEPQRLWLAIAKLQADQTDTARAELTAIAARSTSSDLASLARLRLADLARHEGDLDEAAAQLDATAVLLGPRTANDAMYLTASGSLAVARGELTAATAALRQALSAAAKMPDLPMAAAVGVAAAWLVYRSGDADGAAELLGAADAVRGAPTPEDAETARLGEVLRDDLGESAYTSAYGRGAKLSAEAALARLGRPLQP